MNEEYFLNHFCIHITTFNPKKKVIHINFINTAAITCWTEFHIATYISSPDLMSNECKYIPWCHFYFMLQTISMTESAIVFNFTGTVYEIAWTVASCTERAHVTYYMKNVHFCEELKNDGNMICALYVVMFSIHIS